LNHLEKDGKVVARYDFIDLDSSVADPDSVYGDRGHAYYRNDEHGTMVLSLLAGYDPGVYLGAAWDAEYVLFRTEDTRYIDQSQGERETRIEEYNWAAAIVQAESLGVDIVSSSLGYRTDYNDLLGDHTFEEMTGDCTIISKAARGAVQRGVIIVNAMGNEGYGEGSLGAPADVDGVVGVGGVDSKGVYWTGSSRGPTADGRVKPDVVAQAVSVQVADIYRGIGKYRPNNGTSLATPVVGGLCGLIVQAYPESSPADIRTRLLWSCSFGDGQDSIDTYYGYGIPDAARACLRDNQIYIELFDSDGYGIWGMPVYSSNGERVGTTDSTGIALCTVSDASVDTIIIRHPAGIRSSLAVEQTPAVLSDTLPISSGLSISVSNRKGHPLDKATVYWKRNGQVKFNTKSADSTGVVYIPFHWDDPVDFHACAPGYRCSETETRFVLGRKEEHEIVLTMQQPLFLYPTVLRLGADSARLSVEFNAGEQWTTVSEASVMAVIRTVTGESVWEYIETVTTPEVISFHWNCRNADGRLAVPGTYLLILRYNSRLYRQKFFIIP
jgi:hypothetical protein